MRKRLPKELRKAGRPSRKVKTAEAAPVQLDSDNDDIETNISEAVSNLISQQQGMYLPPQESMFLCISFFS